MIDKTLKYSNVLLLSQEGEVLSTISNKRANWYIRKNLAEDYSTVAPFTRTIKLKFKEKVTGEVKPSSKVFVENQCVMCGIKNSLTLHHVIPRVIRSHFPHEEKSNGREWCVLLCVKHHREIEVGLDKVCYADLPKFSRKYRSPIHILIALKKSRNLNKLPPQRLNKLLSECGYSSIDEIPSSSSLGEFPSESVKLHRDDIKQWALSFTESKGGIEGTKQFFKSHFLSYNPKFLHPEWLI